MQTTLADGTDLLKLEARGRLVIRHPIMRAKADVLTDRDDSASRRPATGSARTWMEVASPLVRTHGLDGRVDVIAKTALGLLPNNHVGTGALQVRGEVGPRIGIDGVNGPQPNLSVHQG